MKRRVLLIIICFMVIGFSTMATTLYLRSDIKIGVNETDFDVYFSAAIIDGNDRTNTVIDGNKTSITFDSKELKSLNDESVLEYTVANNSSQYDVDIDVYITKLSDTDYTKLTNVIDTDSPLQSKSIRNGRATIKLLKVYMGEEDEIDEQYRIDIVATPIEKTEIDTREIDKSELTLYGFIKDNDGNLLSYQTLAIYSDTAHFVKTDYRGMFYVSGLEPGEHEVYVLGDVEIDETLRNKTKEEISNMSLARETFDTGSSNGTSNSNYIIEKIKSFISGKTIKEVALDRNGGIGGNELIYVVSGEEIGYIPGSDHESLDFDNWSTDPTDGEEIDYSKSYEYEDIDKIYATYKDGIVEKNGIVYSSIKRAYDSISTNDETTLKLLANQSIGSSITIDKNIIIDLNSFILDTSGFVITNNNELNIINGSLKSDTLKMLINNNNMNIGNVNFNLKSNNNVDMYAIISEANTTLNLNDVVVTFNSTNDAGFLSLNGLVNVTGSRFELNGNGTDTYLITNSGVLNITAENVGGNVNNLFENNGTLNVGDLNSVVEPTITSLKNVIKGKSGIINIYKGKLESEEEKTLKLVETGKANLYGGKYYSNANNEFIYLTDQSELNILGNIEFLDNSDTKYSIYNDKATVNVLNGTLQFNNHAGILNTGTLIVGSETSSNIPNLISGLDTIEGRDGIINIYKGNIQSNLSNNDAIYLIETGKANLYGGTYNSISSTINLKNDSELNIYSGSYNSENRNSISLAENSKANLYGGTYYSGSSNSIYINNDSEVNISGDIEILDNGTTSYAIYNKANLNVLKGNIQFNSNHGIGSVGTLNIGSSESSDIPSFTDNNNLLSVRGGVTNIYKGTMQTSKGYALYVYEDGLTNVYGGSYFSSASNSIYTKGNGVLNILGNIELPTTGTNYYSVSNDATMNILKGTLQFNNNAGIGNFGTLNVGSKDTLDSPILIDNNNLLSARSGVTNIYKGTMQTSNGYALYAFEEGTVNLYGGAYSSSASSSIYNKGNGEINVLGNIEIFENSSSYYSIVNVSTMNILKGTINFNNCPGIVNRGLLNVGSSETSDIPILNGVNNMINAGGGETNIYKGNLQSTSGAALYIFETGIVNLYGGSYSSEAVNTIYVKGNSELNILGDVEIPLTGSNYYAISNTATINFLNGTTQFYNNSGIGNGGIINIGSEENSNIPILIGVKDLLSISGGELNIYKGKLQSSVGNALNIYNNGKVYAYGGTYYSENSSSIGIAGSGELNVLGNIEILDNGTSSYAIYNKANLNVLKGTLQFNSNAGIGNIGTLNIGSNDIIEVPVLQSTNVVIDEKGGTTNIYKGKLQSSVGNALNIYNNGKVNAYGGTYYSGTSNSINIDGESELNILDDIEVLDNGTVSYAIYNKANLNVLNGTLQFNSNAGIGNIGTLNIGSNDIIGVPVLQSANVVIEEKGGTTNIYKGEIKSKDSSGLNVCLTGKANLYGGTYYSASNSSITVAPTGELNVLGNIEVLDNGTSEYALKNFGTTNILKGIIQFNNNPGISSAGTLNIGNEDSDDIPEIYSGEISIIGVDGVVTVYKGNIESVNNITLYISDDCLGNIYGGTYYSTKKNTIFIKETGELNILGDIEIIDNEFDSYSILNGGTTNVLKGTIQFNNNLGIGNLNVLNIGTQDSVEAPIFISDTTLVFNASGNIDIYNGYFQVANNTAILLGENTITNIYRAEISNSNVYCSILVSESTELNILGDINFLDTGTTYMNVINYGNMNVLKGTLQFNNNSGIVNYGVLNVGSTDSSNIPEIYAGNNVIEGRDGIVNIYKGIIQSRTQNGCNIYENGTLNIYGGEIISSIIDQTSVYNSATAYMYGGTLTNLEGGYTFYNDGGTAIQRGGISPSNYNVTVE